MSVVINGTGSISGLSNVGGIASAQSGSIIQTVQSTANQTTTASSSTTYVTTGISASITPQFSTSKILVMANLSLDNQANGQQVEWTFYRGGSNLLDSGSSSGNGFNGIYAGSSRVQTTSFGCFLDSPATTSSTTYTIYFRAIGAYSITANPSNNSFITLQEIAA